MPATSGTLCFVLVFFYQECISSKPRKDHFSQGPKRMKRNRQKCFCCFFRNVDGNEKPFCSPFLKRFPYPWPPEVGQAALANFLTGRGTNCDRDTNANTNHPPSFPAATSLSLLAGTTNILTLIGKLIAIEKQKQENNFSFSFYSILPFSLSASKPATLLCALGLINMNQTVNDQREWKISKG